MAFHSVGLANGSPRCLPISVLSLKAQASHLASIVAGGRGPVSPSAEGPGVLGCSISLGPSLPELTSMMSGSPHSLHPRAVNHNAIALREKRRQRYSGREIMVGADKSGVDEDHEFRRDSTGSNRSGPVGRNTRGRYRNDAVPREAETVRPFRPAWHRSHPPSVERLRQGGAELARNRATILEDDRCLNAFGI